MIYSFAQAPAPDAVAQSDCRGTSRRPSSLPLNDQPQLRAILTLPVHLLYRLMGIDRSPLNSGLASRLLRRRETRGLRGSDAVEASLLRVLRSELTRLRLSRRRRRRSLGALREALERVTRALDDLENAGGDGRARAAGALIEQWCCCERGRRGTDGERAPPAGLCP